MTYSISYNGAYNSHEVYFTGKPSEATRKALKALKMRWHGVKKCWYGFASESALINAIQDAELQDNGEGATVKTDGYMGGGAIYGSKSNLNLYGAELAAAIRADIKAAGIKGVTISKGKSTYTDTICATVTIEPSDIAPDFTYSDNYILKELANLGIYDGEKWVYWNHIDSDGKGIRTSDAEFKELARKASAHQVKRYGNYKQDINQYYITAERYPEFTSEFLAKLQKVNSIINAYHYDASNSMVDYFDVNFYYNIRTKPGKGWN